MRGTTPVDKQSVGKLATVMPGCRSVLDDLARGCYVVMNPCRVCSKDKLTLWVKKTQECRTTCK